MELYVKTLLEDCDMLLIQEHWLFTENLSLLNVNSDFSSFGISGMESIVFLTGRPMLAVVFLFENVCFHSNICCKRVLCSTSHHKLGKTLVINVYLPTIYGNID